MSKPRSDLVLTEVGQLVLDGEEANVVAVLLLRRELRGLRVSEYGRSDDRGGGDEGPVDEDSGPVGDTLGRRGG